MPRKDTKGNLKRANCQSYSDISKNNHTSDIRIWIFKYYQIKNWRRGQKFCKILVSKSQNF